MNTHDIKFEKNLFKAAICFVTYVVIMAGGLMPLAACFGILAAIFIAVSIYHVCADIWEA